MPLDRSPHHFSLIRNFHLADLFTLGNGCCGTATIFLVMDNPRETPCKIYWAGLLVMGALILDVMDGRIARWRHAASALGRELDSLADIISFGVAPACLARAVGMTAVGDAIALLYFTACGISRLARYNITADTLAAASGKVTHFEGTPIPLSAVLVVIMVLLTRYRRIGLRLPLGVIGLGPLHLHPLVLLFVISGTLMISKTLRIPKP